MRMWAIGNGRGRGQSAREGRASGGRGLLAKAVKTGNGREAGRTLAWVGGVLALAWRAQPRKWENGPRGLVES